MKKIIKEGVIQIGSGVSAVCIMHPLDIVKTRLQLQPAFMDKKDPLYYDGALHCFRKMINQEGVNSLWKGIIPPILAETPKRACKFFTFEQYKKFFIFGSPTPTLLTFSMAGFGAGASEAILMNPFEVVKVRLQADTSREMPSAWAMAKTIVNENGFGLRGLNKGLSATIGRHSLFNMVYFGFYHSVKGYLPEFENKYQEFFRKVAIGFVSGTLGSCFNIPFDVVKSRIQGPQPVVGHIKYSSTIQSINIVYREEGFMALYKGLLPKVLRLGPGGASMLIIYEYAPKCL